MYLSIIILPLLGSIVSGFMGRKVGISGSHFISCTCLILSSLLMSIAFYEVGICGSPVYINLGSWIDLEFMTLSWEFYYDQLTVSLGLAVLYCSSLIHIYSISYMSEDPHVQRFMSYLSAFTAGMLVLICGGNYFVMFIGWEAIGVVSYLLINFYFTRIQANKASILAFTMNRVGDMGMSIGFFALFALFGSLNYATIFSLSPFMNESAITIIALLLLMGAMAKSANIPFHSWLPGSMEAPTPVSALLHAATLVTAGIYLLLRSSPILEYSPTALLIITLVGSSTAFFAGTSGLVQNDLKRIIAFSTISQLGYMVMAIGLSQYNVALMHTVNHAFFKALLFLGAGAVIHSFADQQDVRKMGGLIKFLPFTYSVMLVGSLSLLAIPFLTGFYSKDLILELAYGQYSFTGMYAYILGSITAGITAFYSFRLINLVYFTYPNGPKQNYLNAHESSLAIVIPLFILALFSILFGFVFSDLFVGIGSDFFGNSLFTHPNNISMVEAEFSLSLPIKLLPAILSISGALLAIFMYHKTPEFIVNLTENSLGRKIYSFLNGKYYFDVIYNHYIISNGLLLGYKISKEIDKGVIELLGPYGLSNIFTVTGKNISKLDTGIVTTYSLYITLGLLFLLFLVFTPILIDTSMLNEFRLAIIYIATLILILSPLLIRYINNLNKFIILLQNYKFNPIIKIHSKYNRFIKPLLNKNKISNGIKNLIKQVILLTKNDQIISSFKLLNYLFIFFIVSLIIFFISMYYLNQGDTLNEIIKLEVFKSLINLLFYSSYMLYLALKIIITQSFEHLYLIPEEYLAIINSYEPSESINNNSKDPVKDQIVAIPKESAEQNILTDTLILSTDNNNIISNNDNYNNSSSSNNDNNIDINNNDTSLNNDSLNNNDNNNSLNNNINNNNNSNNNLNNDNNLDNNNNNDSDNTSIISESSIEEEEKMLRFNYEVKVKSYDLSQRELDEKRAAILDVAIKKRSAELVSGIELAAIDMKDNEHLKIDTTPTLPEDLAKNTPLPIDAQLLRDKINKANEYLPEQREKEIEIWNKEKEELDELDRVKAMCATDLDFNTLCKKLLIVEKQQAIDYIRQRDLDLLDYYRRKYDVEIENSLGNSQFVNQEQQIEPESPKPELITELEDNPKNSLPTTSVNKIIAQANENLSTEPVIDPSSTTVQEREGLAVPTPKASKNEDYGNIPHEYFDF